MLKKIVIVGAGQAGFSVAAKLRSSGFEGQVTLIGEEAAPPYQRPPLSKKYLMGEMALDRLFLRPQNYYSEQGIDLLLNETVLSINRTNKTVVTAKRTLPYDTLVLTTGSTPHRLPARIGGDLHGVYGMRDLKDADAMAPEFKANAKVLVVGGGYIGLEAAAVAATKGLHVTLVEMADRILQRVAAPQTSAYFRALHQSHGVDIREGVGLDHLNGSPRVTGAVLSDGSTLEVDFVIVGVGIAPGTALAKAAGLDLDNGIKTNALGQTSDADIWAAGDCASFPHNASQLRLESVPNAIDQAECIAQNILGAALTYVPQPWFWSDQYEVKLQIAGLNTGYDQVITRLGDKPGAISFWYYQGQTLLAVDAANDPRAYMVGKRLIEAGKSPNPDLIADASTDLKSLLKP